MAPGAKFSTMTAARFAALRVFHLDDLGTEPGECLRAGWAGLELGQVQNTDAGKKGRKPAVCSHFLVLPQWHRLRQMWMSWTLVGAPGIRGNQANCRFKMTVAGGGDAPGGMRRDNPCARMIASVAPS